MNRRIVAVLALACGLAGCVGEFGAPDQWPSALVQAVNDNQSSAAAADIQAAQSDVISGSVSGAGNYQIFDLGPGAAGDNWVIAQQSMSYSAGPFTLVLLDEDEDLLMRTVVSRQTPLKHTARHTTPHVYLGVTPASVATGGAFNLEVQWQGGLNVPSAARQVVYLSFEGASGVRVHGRGAIALPAFDASTVSADYSGASEQMALEIVETMRLDYAPYDVTVTSSFDGPAPQEAGCTVVYFGGSDDTLLGLADNVDMYNANKQQVAVVYVDSFGPYALMGLDAEEMGLMIGNVGSHELGHLLGLYHTAEPDELMDSTGSAWDLAQNQSFGRAPLERAVFPTGMQNAPELLRETLGLNPSAAQPSAKLADAAKIVRRERMKAFTLSEISRRCGICLDPDDIRGD